VLIKKIGYGSLKMMPDELWALSAAELVDMYEAHIDAVNEEFDTEMQRTSWFTSLLMNATGNFKKRIKPDKLYTPLEKQKSKDTKENQQSYVDQQREELKKKFNIG
jgi:hypothetical protein